MAYESMTSYRLGISPQIEYHSQTKHRFGNSLGLNRNANQVNVVCLH